MSRAHARNPVKTQTWWFRKDVTPTAVEGHRRKSSCTLPCRKLAEADPEAAARAKEAGDCIDDDVEEMTMGEVFCGKGSHFPGLLPLVYAYLEHIKVDRETFRRVDLYLSFIEERATGTIMTNADWIRNFVTSHPDYKQDSVVSPAIAHDLAKACDAVGCGDHQPAELLGVAAGKADPIVASEAYGTPLVSEKVACDARAGLVARLTGMGGKPKLSWRERSASDSGALEPLPVPTGAAASE